MIVAGGEDAAVGGEGHGGDHRFVARNIGAQNFAGLHIPRPKPIIGYCSEACAVARPGATRTPASPAWQLPDLVASDGIAETDHILGPARGAVVTNCEEFLVRAERNPLGRDPNIHPADRFARGDVESLGPSAITGSVDRFVVGAEEKEPAAANASAFNLSRFRPGFPIP